MKSNNMQVVLDNPIGGQVGPGGVVGLMLGPPAHVPKALILEQDTLTRVSERLLLGFGGIQVLATDDGSKAEEILKEEDDTVDLVVVDFDISPKKREQLLEALSNLEVMPAILCVKRAGEEVDLQLWTEVKVLERPFLPGEFLSAAKELVQ